jgi:hypothetical protein
LADESGISFWIPGMSSRSDVMNDGKGDADEAHGAA